MLRTPFIALAMYLGSALAPAQATVIADSQAQFSGSQGSDGWYYGYYNRSLDGDAQFSSGEFAQFDTYWAGSQSWRRSQDGESGDESGVYLALNAQGGHPSGIGPDAQQIHEIWAMRRYVAAQAGQFWLDFELFKENLNPRAGGITGHIFLNGVELFAQYIATDDGLGVHLVIPIVLEIGDLLDFAIDPTGIATDRDNPRSGRSDGTVFRMRLLDALEIPAPAALGLVSLGLVLPRRRRVHQ
ncbi:MAG: hypothetical protein HYV16_13075 [Gammaproteobacteria bacterium]|nr:hypothetical protein [Gammaproteobacteria bacterium]